MNKTLRDLLLLTLLLAAARAPFFLHPLQGDDIYYLKGAAHARLDPLHPHHATYIFQGRLVSMAGHPHPPLNAGLLGLLPDSLPAERLWYSLLMLVSVLSTYAIARNFTGQAFGAALLFAVTPVFWVSGNTFDSDILLLACLTSGIALFVHHRHWWAAVPLFLSGLAAYQAVVFIPILWLLGRGRVPACAPAAAVAAYQLFEKFSTGQWPVAMAAQYFGEYGLQSLSNKLTSAAALTAHLAWLTGPVAGFRLDWPLLAAAPAAFIDFHPLFWASFALGVLLLFRVEGWLGWWVRIFFAASLLLFFAGAARYLLPVAPALAILAAGRLSRPRLAAAIVMQALLAFALSYASMRHWQAYKDIAARVSLGGKTWVAGEWSLRYYLEQRGAQPILRGQRIGPGSVVVRSGLGFPVPYTVGGGREEPVAVYDIPPAIPIVLMGLHAHSAWMTSTFGVRPFDLSRQSLDRVTVTRVAAAAIERTALPVNAPDADQYFLSGVYGLEDGRYRWMARTAEIVLKAKNGVIAATVFLPQSSPARRLAILAGGAVAADAVLQQGLQTIRSAPVRPSGDRVVIRLECDRSFIAPGDGRDLSLILQSIAIE